MKGAPFSLNLNGMSLRIAAIDGIINRQPYAALAVHIYRVLLESASHIASVFRG